MPGYNALEDKSGVTGYCIQHLKDVKFSGRCKLYTKSYYLEYKQGKITKDQYTKQIRRLERRWTRKLKEQKTELSDMTIGTKNLS